MNLMKIGHWALCAGLFVAGAVCFNISFTGQTMNPLDRAMCGVVGAAFLAAGAVWSTITYKKG